MPDNSGSHAGDLRRRTRHSDGVKFGEVRDLVRVQVPDPRPAARLAACASVADVERLARRRLPRPVYDYVAGGADDEISLAANRDAFARHRFRPRALQDVRTVDLTTTLFGRPVAAPVVLAPTGYTRMIDAAGEPAVAAAAAAAGLPYTLSTMASTSLADVAAVAPDADRWFQLYVLRDRARTEALVRQAADAGYRVLEVAVDTAVAGNRRRDVRNGFTIPPRFTLGAIAGLAAAPRYWVRTLRAPAMQFALLGGTSGDATIASITSQFDPGVTWDDIARLREVWTGPLVLKGPLSPADAAHAATLGVDGVHLSNHGGRQLDRTVAPLDLVAGVRAATPAGFGIVVDSGVRSGADAATALALGADAVAIGRAYLYGLAAGGTPGVRRVVDLLQAELARTLALLGCTTVAEVRDHGHDLLSPPPHEETNQ